MTKNMEYHCVKNNITTGMLEIKTAGYLYENKRQLQNNFMHQVEEIE